MKKLMLILLVGLCSCNKYYHKYHYGSFYSKPTKREINKAMKVADWYYQQPNVKIHIH